MSLKREHVFYNWPENAITHGTLYFYIAHRRRHTNLLPYKESCHMNVNKDCSISIFDLQIRFSLIGKVERSTI